MMSAATRKPQPASGYGASPHGRRLEGYPIDQATSATGNRRSAESEALALLGSHSRDGSLHATDAASRPAKPAPTPLLFPNAENAL